MSLSKNLVFSSYIYWKFFNRLLRVGHKEKYEIFCFYLFYLISRVSPISPIFFIFQLFSSLHTPLELIPRKKGGRIHFVAAPVPYARQFKLAFKYFRIGLKKRKGQQYYEGLFLELKSILFLETGSAINARRQVWVTALENRAFRHFRWR